MVYVYAIVYRDKDGFTAPVPLDEHRPAVFFEWNIARLFSLFDAVFDVFSAGLALSGALFKRDLYHIHHESQNSDNIEYVAQNRGKGGDEALQQSRDADASCRGSPYRPNRSIPHWPHRWQCWHQRSACKSPDRY